MEIDRDLEDLEDVFTKIQPGPVRQGLVQRIMY
jgi:hypothetical protein